MAAKLPTLVNPSDLYTEDVLKCIKGTIRCGDIRKTIPRPFADQKYDASKTFARNDQTFVTTITDEERAWKEKFDRRKKNLTYGFFADKTKPYQTVGNVYLEAGDLVLNSITDSIKSKITRLPRHYNDVWKSTGSRKTTSQPKKALNIGGPMNQHLDNDESRAGFSGIKTRLNEINQMKKSIQAEQSLSGYLTKKKLDLYHIEKKGLEMKCPPRNNWKIVRTIGKIMGACKRADPVADQLKVFAGTGGAVARAFRKNGKKTQSPIMNNDLKEMEDREEILQKFRNDSKQKYLIVKLQSINSLFCAIFNMKVKTLKSHQPLTCKAVKDLLNSDVTLDTYGRPVSWKHHFQQNVDDHGNSDGPATPEGSSDTKPSTAQAQSISRKRYSSISFGMNHIRRPRLAQFASKLATKPSEAMGPKIETWEDLMNTGEKKVGTSTKPPLAPGGANKYSMKLSRRRDTATATQQPLVADHVAPWNAIQQTEKVINEKRKIAMLGSSNQRTAEDVLNDIRVDFTRLQKELSKEMGEELERQRMEQFQVVQNKFQTITFGPITVLALEKMRTDAEVLSKDRKDSSTKPLAWSISLKSEIKKETGLRNETINCILKKVLRFQYEDGRSLVLAKEKLCLLVMSMPAHLLLTHGMTDAICFMLHRVLTAPPELLDHWLLARKLSVISAVLRSGRKS